MQSFLMTTPRFVLHRGLPLVSLNKGLPLAARSARISQNPTGGLIPVCHASRVTPAASLSMFSSSSSILPPRLFLGEIRWPSIINAPLSSDGRVSTIDAEIATTRARLLKIEKDIEEERKNQKSLSQQIKEEEEKGERADKGKIARLERDWRSYNDSLASLRKDKDSLNDQLRMLIAGRNQLDAERPQQSGAKHQKSPPLPHFTQPDLSKIFPGKMEFAETEAMRKAVGMMAKSIRECPVGTDKRGIQIPFLVGSKGVGKTRTAFEVATRASRLIPPGRRHVVLYFNFSYIPNAWAGIQVGEFTQLAMVLVRALEPQKDRAWDDVTWESVKERAKEDLGKNAIVILIIDEVQVNLDLTRRIIAACQDTMTWRGDLLVLPIEVGRRGITEYRPSLMMIDAIHLKALKGSERAMLGTKFHESLGISKEVYASENLKHFRRLFKMCGGFPSVVDILQNKAADTYQDSLREGTLGSEQAGALFKDVLMEMYTMYGSNRWHAAIENDPSLPKEVDVVKFPDYRATASILRRLVLDVLCERAVTAENPIISSSPDDVSGKNGSVWARTYDEVRNTGLVELTSAGGGLFHVKVPLLVLLTMDALAHILPPEVEATEPFKWDWNIQERTGAIAAYVRILNGWASGKSFPVRDLRPGCQWIGADDVLIAPRKNEEPEFVFWGSPIEGKEGLIFRSRGGSGGLETLSKTVVAMTKPGDKAVDGVICFPEDRVMVVSQYKSRGESKKQSGVLANTTLENSGVRDIIVAMQAQVEAIKRRYPHVSDFIVVYDIFSDRNEPPRFMDLPRSLGNLGVKERVMVTRGDERIKQALGATLSEMRGMD